MVLDAAIDVIGASFPSDVVGFRLYGPGLGRDGRFLVLHTIGLVLKVN